VIPTRKEIENALKIRHTCEVQYKLAKANVAIAGLGGLGSNVAFFLARAGVGNLQLIDYDKVDLTNLNRQQYRICDLGQYKTEALKKQLLEINPYLNIRIDTIMVDQENIKMLLEKAEVICEAFDVPEHKAMLVNKVLQLYPEKYLVAASGMAGWGASNDIITRQIGRRFYLCGDGTSSAENQSLMAPRVGICAGHEANLILELLLKQHE